MTVQTPFLEKVINRSPLTTENQAQTATNVLFRILRDLMPTSAANRVADELRGKEDPQAEMELKDLWKDTNVMVSFFSQISPVQQLSIRPATFFLRLQQEAALPSDADPKEVTRAIFSAVKEELSLERAQEVSGFLPDEIRQIWDQA